MRKLLEFLNRKYIWALIVGIILSLSTAFTMLDALVIPKSYIILSQQQNVADTTGMQSGGDAGGSAGIQEVGTLETGTEKDMAETSTEEGTAVTGIEAEITDYSYKDDNISINIDKVSKNGVVFYVADVQLSSIDYLKTAFADNTYGRNITQTTSEMAEENNAIFAINGDYYGFRDTGLVIRNGVLYRDTARSAPDNKALTINSSGELEIITEGETEGTALVDGGILQGFSFGPALVQDGQLVQNSRTKVSQGANPRTAIGQISPLHYLFIVVDGRSRESKGMTLAQLAQEFLDRGATVAYNLDGGGSSAMWFNGKVINNPTDGRRVGERSISDIVYIGK